MISTDQPTIFDQQVVLSAISSRGDGNMSLLKQMPELAMKHRRQLFETLGVAMDNGICMNVRDPKTWDSIHDVSPADLGTGMYDIDTALTADALVTNQKNMALMLLTADCSPIIVHDPVNNVLALVHMGWQSTAVNLAAKIVEHVSHRYGSKATDIKIYNGPSIRATSYIFEPPIEQMDWPGWRPYLIEVGDGKIGIDLVGYNRSQFIAAGVPQAQIEICAVDTGTSAHYYSHYRAMRQGKAADEGRFATICMLK